LTQGIVRPSFNVVLRVNLFCGGIYFLKNFTLCDLDNFNVIIGNTFLDAYKINILHNEGRLRVCAKCGFKLVNLDAMYNFALVEMGVNLVVLDSELKSFSFFILMYLKISHGEFKPQGAKQALACILDSLNKFSEVLTNELLNAFPLYRKVDHKIKLVPILTLPSKAPYRLNQKELEELPKKHDLLN
jgi:hypothetical protein